MRHYKKDGDGRRDVNVVVGRAKCGETGMLLPCCSYGDTRYRFHHEEHEGTRRMEFDELSSRVIG
jgi:hypothetical protein